MTPGQAAVLFAAAAAAGVMNALAGGGTILTFPVLLLLGESGITANATSTVALLPGAAASLVGYRREVATHRRWLSTLFVPSLLGGAAGSLLLLSTPEKLFARLAPWLILFATLLFFLQSFSRFRNRFTAQPQADGSSVGLRAAWLAQFAVAIYGGYFGAGIGILMLVLLGSLGLENIHAMNGLKNFFGICINGVAATVFILSGRVDWPAALVMLAGAVLGGFAGANFGRRIGQQKARGAVIAVGCLLAFALWWQQR
ncbi:MAG: sulfite exporter TauE/SafE family protein [Thermoanaerobaculia bacterium]